VIVGDREGGEGHPAARIPAVDRLHEPETRHLHEVIKGLGGMQIALGELVGERELLLDHPLPVGGSTFG